MALVTKANTFSSGATIFASEHNTNFDTIYNEFNGNIVNANIGSAAAIENSKLNLASISQNVVMTGTLDVQGDVALGNGADSLTINCSTGITYTPAATWTFTAAQTVSGTWADLGTVTTADINGGTVNGLTSLGMSTGADITEIADEDDMTSDSATKLATQQSIKAYADTKAPGWKIISSATFASSADVTMAQAVGEGDVYKFIIEYEVAGGGSADNWLITDSNATSYTWSLQTQGGTTVENEDQTTDATTIRIATTGLDNFVGAEVYLEVIATGRNTGTVLMIDCVAQNTDGIIRSIGVGRHGSEISTALHLKCGSAIMTGRYYIQQLQTS